MKCFGKCGIVRPVIFCKLQNSGMDQADRHVSPDFPERVGECAVFESAECLQAVCTLCGIGSFLKMPQKIPGSGKGDTVSAIIIVSF